MVTNQDDHMFEGIEFTDRYGGRTPSRLTSCWNCEAMGCYPQPPSGAISPDGTIQIDHPDDWEFVTCTECNGTARVSLVRTLTRIPKWLVQGVPFVYRYGVRREFNPDAGRWKSLKIAVGCAYLADLGIWNPNGAYHR